MFKQMKVSKSWMTCQTHKFGEPLDWSIPGPLE